MLITLLSGTQVPHPSFWASVIGIWVSVWAIRRKSDVDYRLDSTEKTIRWSIAFIGLSVTRLPGSSLGYVRLAGLLLGMAFLCWPNFAHHLARLFGHRPLDPDQ